jgi:hypothetical protein
MRKIFTVTALHLTPVKKQIKYKKTAAWFNNFKMAELYVLNDPKLFGNGKYEVAVIEEIESGTCGFAVETWYEALYSYLDQEHYCTLRTAKPKALKRLRNFAMVDR